MIILHFTSQRFVEPRVDRDARRPQPKDLFELGSPPPSRAAVPVATRPRYMHVFSSATDRARDPPPTAPG